MQGIRETLFTTGNRIALSSKPLLSPFDRQIRKKDPASPPRDSQAPGLLHRVLCIPR